jgi:hypothetical protein
MELSARIEPANRSRTLGAARTGAVAVMPRVSPRSQRAGWQVTGYKRLKPRVMMLSQRARKALKRSSLGSRR